MPWTFRRGQLILPPGLRGLPDIVIELNPHVLNCQIEDFRAVREAAADPEFISLAIADPYYPPAPHVIAAFCEAASGGFTRYAPLAGDPELRQAIASKVRSANNIVADPATDVFVTHGAGHAFLVSLIALLQPGDEVLTTDPGFPLNFGSVQLLGAKPVVCSIAGPDGLASLPERMEAAITPRTRAMILHNPINPTGHVMGVELLKRLAAVACKYDLAVLSDEVYERFVYDESTLPSIASFPGMRERTVTLFGFSKDHVISGLRVGYLVSSERIVAAISRIVQNNGVGAGAAAQRAALAALTGPQDQVNAMVAEFKALRHVVTDRLNAISGLRCQLPAGGYFCFVDATAYGDAEELCRRMIREARVGLSPGSWNGPAGAGHFRLCYGAAPQQRIAIALDRLEHALTAMLPSADRRGRL